MPLVLGAANWYHAAATRQGIALNGNALVQLLLVYYRSQLLIHFMLVSCYFRMNHEIDEMWKDRRVVRGCFISTRTCAISRSRSFT